MSNKKERCLANYANIPEELKQQKHWVVVLSNKNPFDIFANKLAKANDPSTWNSFSACLEFLTKHYGEQYSKLK